MKEAFELVNQMQREAVIDRYAVGGAVGATLYLEPAATLDIDIFVKLSGDAGSLLISLSPIYDYLKQHGGRAEGEHMVIGGWPMQFLPVSTGLEEEGLHEAIETDIEGVPVWVMRAEHLAAIALQTGRSKDHARILQFLEQDAVDRARLERILKAHGLGLKWEKFKARFLNE
ncbi:MAG TPA: hypothetical protein VFP59_04255 [Candidatus Angelobacter sp.]|nr:hypothetical protein [Candidatus Angelobacter sp.]